MFIFRMIEFVFQLLTAILVVLLLQISVGGRTLEDFFISFVQKSKTTAPIRQLAYSGVKYVQPLGVTAPPVNSTDQDEKNRRALASPSSSQKSSSLTPIIINWIDKVYRDNVEAYQNYMGQIGQHLKTQVEQGTEDSKGNAEKDEMSNEELMEEIVEEIE